MFFVRHLAKAVAPVLLAFWSTCWAGEPVPLKPVLSGTEIIKRAVQRAEARESADSLNGFAYTKKTLTEKFDSSGKLKERKEKVYAVAFRDGKVMARLLQVNGHAPPEDEMKEQAENESAFRKLLGQPKSGKLVSRDNFLSPELAAHYQFELVGTNVVNGRPAYRLTMRPKDPPLPVHRIADRLLNRMSGTIWIDTAEYELAKAELRLGSDVDLLGGILGSLRKVEYTMDRTRLPNGMWFSTLTSGDFEGRKLFESMRVKTRSVCTDIRRAAG